MAEDRIDSIILLDAIQKEFTAVSGFINKLKTDITSIPQVKSLIENANAPKDLAAATDKLAVSQKNVAASQQAIIAGQGQLVQMQQAYNGTIKSLNANLDLNIKKQNDTKSSIKSITEEQKKLTKEITAGAISADEYRLKNTKLSDSLLKYKQRLADVNAELKDQIKLQFAAPGTIKEARVQNSQLTRIRDNTQDPEKLRQINALIDKNNELIDANSDKLAKQKINIGNYQGAANSIVDALNKQESKLQSLGAAYTSFGSQIATQRNVISGFKGDVNSTDYKKATAELARLETEYKRTGVEVGKTRTVIEGFRRAADISAQQGSQNVAGLNKSSAAYTATSQALNGYVSVLRGSRGPTKLLGEALGIGATQADTLRLVIEHSLQGFAAYFRTKKAAAVASEEAAAALTAETAAAGTNIGITEAQIVAQTNLATAQGATALTAQAEVIAQTELDALMGTGIVATEAQAVAQANLAAASVAATLAIQAEDVASTQLIAAYSADAIAATAATAATTALAVSEVAATGATTALNTALKFSGIGLLLAAVGLIIYSLVEFIKTAKAAAVASEAYTASLDDFKKAAGDAVVKVEQVGAAFTQAKEGVIGKEKALKIYNDTLGDTFGKTTSLAEAERLYTEKAGVYIKIMGLKAQANALFAKSAEETAKGLVASQEDQVSMVTKLQAGVIGSLAGVGGSALAAATLANEQNIAVNKLVSTSKSNAAILEKEGIKLSTQAELLAKGANLTLDKPEKLKTKKDGSLSSIKDLKDTAFEQDKVRLERQLRLLNADINDEKTYYTEKITLLEEYNKQSTRLLELQAAEDIRHSNEEKAREVANLNDSKKGKTGTQVARINQNILIVEKNNAEAIKLINVKLEDDKLKIAEKGLVDKKDILKAQLKIEEEFSKDQVDLLEVQNKIISKIRKRQIAEELQDEKDKADKKIQLEKDINDAKKQLQEEAVDTIKSFVNNGFDREVQNLDERKRLLDEDTARRINQINLLGLTEMERTRQTAIVQKEAAFQNEQIEKRKRQIAVERAKFEKAASVASIIAGTAQAIVAALGQKPFTPANIGFAALVGGIGLLQLTRAIATPLPKYKDGRGKGKDEMAIVGDGGKHEYIMRGNGIIEQTPRTDTLTRLMPNDVVFKDNNALLNAMLNASNPYGQILKAMSGIKPAPGATSLDREILGELKEIRKRSGISIHNNIPIESTAYYQHHIKN